MTFLLADRRRALPPTRWPGIVAWAPSPAHAGTRRLRAPLPYCLIRPVFRRPCGPVRSGV